MDWKYLLLRFDGRISRQPYWIGIIALVAAQFVLTAGLLAAFGFPISGYWEPRAPLSAIAIRYAVTLALTWPILAVMIKRLHDRNRTGWWAGLLNGLGLLFDPAEAAGLAGTEQEPGIAVLVLALPALLLAVWLFVELGFLKGTQGPNRHGADPLGAVAPDASL